jgi:hypothetical protein
MGFVAVSVNRIVLGGGVPRNAFIPCLNRRVNASNHRGIVRLLGPNRIDSKQDQETNRRHRPCRAKPSAMHHAETLLFLAHLRISLSGFEPALAPEPAKVEDRRLYAVIEPCEGKGPAIRYAGWR